MQFCNAIEISYFVGKTLLLMAKVLQLSQLYGNSVVFVIDSFLSSDLFQIKIGTFCEERDIEFHSFDLSEDKEKEKFKDLIKGRPECLVVIDELSPYHFDFVCDVTKELSQVVCAINPMLGKPEDFPDNRNGFKSFG